MANLPLPEEMVGPNVTEAQFRSKLIQFITNVDRSYSSLAAANADISNIALGVKVEILDPEIGGYYQKTSNESNSLTKIVNDPFENLKKKIDLEIINRLSNLSSISDLDNLLNLFDLNGNSSFRVDQKGDVYIYGRTDSVQKVLKDLEKKITPVFPVDTLSDLHLLSDKNDLPVFRINQKGEIFIFGYSDSLQSILAKVQDAETLDETKSVTVFNKNVLYVRDYLDRITQLVSSQLSTAAIPHFSNKQQFSLGQTWVDSIRMNLSAERLIVAGYDPTLRDDIGVVHPQVWSFDKEAGGYRYWLGLNPYTNTNEDIELPFIYGSNDPNLKEWELIPTFPTPFDVDPPNIGGVTSGHCSDSGFVYDIKSGDLLFFWRVTRYRGNRDITTATNEFRASRFDGKKWSEKFTIVDESLIIGEVTDYLLSPNIVYNPVDNLYHMFTINNDGKMYRRTTNDLNSRQWSTRTECIFDNTNFTPWHLDMKFVGGKLVALIHVDTAGANEYRFAVSDDFLNFNVSATSIVNDSNPALYKATFLPLLNQNDFKMRIIYTSDQTTTPNWQLHVADTTSVSY
ncbi:sialidase family protein [Acinetobacter junii]|uniref:sialidase family protein n=1 Tax=Acinetobacter junii TaxID=40215 RepID=UPI000F674763|nr:sialidase family protein [Acinetobacter junii]RSE33373.1 exo-alpha-sialidase [Acinetobacter junii]